MQHQKFIMYVSTKFSTLLEARAMQLYSFMYIEIQNTTLTLGLHINTVLNI